MTMYIALEGIKGSGKSTLFTRLQAAMRARGIDFASLCPTRPRTDFAPLDWLYSRTGNCWPDWATEQIYARRARHHVAAALSRRAPLILGERSLFTSYVTRWDHAAPERGMRRVRQLEHSSPVPDHVLYLALPVALACQRIAHRSARHYGTHDQKNERLHEADALYRQLARCADKWGLGATKWHWLDATQDIEQLLEQAMEIICSLGAACPGAPSIAAPSAAPHARFCIQPLLHDSRHCA